MTGLSHWLLALPVPESLQPGVMQIQPFTIHPVPGGLHRVSRGFFKIKECQWYRRYRCRKQHQSQNLVTGSGGAFTGGTTGMIAWATGSTSTGIIGLGANAASITVSNGSGGVLRGYHGLFARGDNASGFGS